MRRETNRKKQKSQAAAKNLPCRKNDRAVVRIEDIGSGGEGIGFLKISEQRQDINAQNADTQGAGTQGTGTQGAGTQDANAQDAGTQGTGTQDANAQVAGTQNAGALGTDSIDAAAESGERKPVNKGFAVFVKDAVPGSKDCED